MIGIQATAQMAAEKEAVGVSRGHVYWSNCILLNEIIVYSVFKLTNVSMLILL